MSMYRIIQTLSAQVLSDSFKENELEMKKMTIESQYKSNVGIFFVVETFSIEPYRTDAGFSRVAFATVGI